MNVLTVCRMNQGRSPFAEAVVSKFFPEVHVTSAGVEAINGVLYLPEVVSIARRWGIEISSGQSRSISSIPEFQLADLIVCAEEWIAAEVKLMSPKGQVISYESVAPDPSFMPTDPERLRGRNMESELAKVGWINVRAVEGFMEVPIRHHITSVVPETEVEVEAAIEWVLEERLIRDAIVIDADLRSPLAQVFRARGLRVGNFSNLNQLHDFDVFSSVVEQRDPERNLLSEDWRARIDSLGSEREILLITSPQRTQGGSLPDSYLASIPTGNIKIIRR